VEFHMNMVPEDDIVEHTSTLGDKNNGEVD